MVFSVDFENVAGRPMTIFAFDGVFMLQNSHAIIFRYFVRNASIHDLNRFYSSIFAKLKLFSETPELDYCM